MGCGEEDKKPKCEEKAQALLDEWYEALKAALRQYEARGMGNEAVVRKGTEILLKVNFVESIMKKFDIKPTGYEPEVINKAKGIGSRV